MLSQYLLVAANKFYYSANWLPAKRDIALDVPDELDLSELKAQGQQPGEELLPEGDAASAGRQLPAMEREGCKQLTMRV